MEKEYGMETQIAEFKIACHALKFRKKLQVLEEEWTSCHARVYTAVMVTRSSYLC